MKMNKLQYYEYCHSEPDGNGMEYISFLVDRPLIDERGLLNGRGVYIRIDNKRQRTDVYKNVWVGGAPRDHEHILTLMGEIIVDFEVPEMMKRRGIEVEEKMDGGTDNETD